MYDTFVNAKSVASSLFNDVLVHQMADSLFVIVQTQTDAFLNTVFIQEIISKMFIQ